jgi:hypothetical protein
MEEVLSEKAPEDHGVDDNIKCGMNEELKLFSRLTRLVQIIMIRRSLVPVAVQPVQMMGGRSMNDEWPKRERFRLL